MIVEKSPLYFEPEVVYKLLKLHNAMEESNSSQHTKQTHIYTALLRYILQSLQCYINDRRTYFLNIVAIGVFQFMYFLLLKYAAQVIKWNFTQISQLGENSLWKTSAKLTE